ncbi:MAG TPA: TraR/DksA family transcriptional regulator [Bryobacteraceae bacterium]|jgi:RNA polymerase-binding transcription factor|nr:TraR/DksA family transcriptional regulator [Bryobacteraceae bacterium]
MTNTELGKFRNVLKAVVIEMDSSMRRREDIHIQSSADELDRVLGAAERELAALNLVAASAKRRNAQEALRRMEQGIYGICEECEEPISPRRLAAMPAAVLCIRCQEAADCRCGARSGRTVLAMAA